MAGEPPLRINRNPPVDDERSAEYHHYCRCLRLHGTRPASFLKPRLTTPQSHGYATEEFEVTRERLGVYLPVRAQRVEHYIIDDLCTTQVQHIDNPKGYGEGKDPREVDPGLRPVCIVCFAISQLLTVICRYSPFK